MRPSYPESTRPSLLKSPLCINQFLLSDSGQGFWERGYRALLTRLSGFDVGFNFFHFLSSG
jgi:hypothetical protein